MKTAEILKSFCFLQVLNLDEKEEVNIYVLGGHTTPGQMSGILHGWKRNESDMC